jgi:hypothetical protein
MLALIGPYKGDQVFNRLPLTQAGVTLHHRTTVQDSIIPLCLLLSTSVLSHYARRDTIAA